MNETDLRLLRAAIDVAARAREHGNHPFGAVLADATGTILMEAENTVVTTGDATGHAETNLIRSASPVISAATLATSTLYASTEPCPMCAGAIFWSGVSRVIFALPQDGLYGLTGDSPHKLPLSCRNVFSHAARTVEVEGPALEPEALKVHLGFWS